MDLNLTMSLPCGWTLVLIIDGLLCASFQLDSIGISSRVLRLYNRVGMMYVYIIQMYTTDMHDRSILLMSNNCYLVIL